MRQRTTFEERRTFLLFSATVFGSAFFPGAVSAQDCSASRIAELNDQCLDILNDVASTIQTGRNLESAAWSKAQEAIQPSYDCLKGGYDLGKALFKDCNPSSPGVNPVACIETLVGVPDTIEACEIAVTLIREAWSLYEQASFIFGAAEVAFFDQGGGEIAGELEKCGESSCRELGQAMSDYARQNKERAERNRDRLNEHENQLTEVRNELEMCQGDSNSCTELPEHNSPDLEPADSGPPDISFD